MTYCVGVLAEAGLVFASDRRTNAGVDHVATVKKMFVFEQPGDRLLVLLTAGNLAITQSVVSLLEEACERDDAGSLMSATSLFRAAQIVGAALRQVHSDEAAHLQEQGVAFSAGLLLGGQIKGEAPRLFQIYEAGNFIEASAEMPFLQIGEAKYGKPILDRLIGKTTSLPQAAKIVLLSYLPTLVSNVSVGLPIDLFSYERDSLSIGQRWTLEERDPYFEALETGWGEGLARVFADLPDPPKLPEP